MATKFRENFSGTHPISDTGAKVWLAANTELTWTVPGDNTVKYRACFTYTYDAPIWVKLNDTIVVPVVGNAVDTYNEQFRPDLLYVNGGDVLHFISTASHQFGVSLLELPG